MKKTLKLFISFLIILISISVIIVTIGYEKTRLNDNELVLLEEIDNKIYSTPKIQLNNIEMGIIFLSCVIFFISLLYMIINLINGKLIERWYHFFITSILILSLSLASTIVITMYSNKYILVSKNSEFIKQPYHSYIISPIGTYEIAKDSTIFGKTFYGNNSNTNTLLIRGGTNVTISDSIVYKKGNSSSNISSTVYGTNSAVLVLKDSYLKINSTTINTSSEGSSGLFAVLDKSKIEANMVNIETSNKESIGVVASINSTINITESKIKTSSKGSSAVFSTRGGVINIYSSNLKTTAFESPIINTNSVIKIKDSTGDANGSPVLYMTDTSKVTIDNCTFKASASKITDKSYDGAIVISDEYLDNNYKESSILNIFNSDISIKKQSKLYSKAPLFVVNNNNAIINLSNNIFDFGSGVFLKTINSTSSKNVLVILNSNTQQINGDLVLSNNSVLELNFTNTQFKGSIDNSKKSKKITLNITDSTLELTNDSYVTIINNNKNEFENIISNGYTLYYDSNYNPLLEGKTYKLKDGGYVKPIN